MNKFVKYALGGVRADVTLFAAGCGGDKKEEKKIDMNRPKPRPPCHYYGKCKEDC